MTKYILTSPDGRKFEVDSPTPPTEELAQQVFRAASGAPQMTLEVKTQLAANKAAYEQRKEELAKEHPFVSLIEEQPKTTTAKIARPVARLGLATTQGIANAGFNPAGHVARAFGVDTKPLTPENGAERAAELAGQYGYDAAAIYALLSGGAEVAGLSSLAPTTSKAVLGTMTAGGLPLAFTGSTGSAIATGIINPKNEYLRILTDLAGGGAATLATNPFKSPTLASNADRQAVKQIGSRLDDASLAENLREVKRTGGNLLEVGSDDVLDVAQKARQQSMPARKILTDSAIASAQEQPIKTQAVIDEVLGTQGKNASTRAVMEQAQQEARPLFEEVQSMGNLAPTKEQLAKQNFDRWFEGSQVVDENGQPRRYYHGSLRKFDKFKQANNDYNFAPDENFAYNYAESKGFEQGIDAEPQLYEVFLNSKKPFDFENPEDIKNLSNYIKGKKIRVFGNPKKEEEFLRNLKGEYYDTKLDEGEFEKLLSDKYNKWYSPDNHDVNYSQSSVNTDKIFSVNPDEEYFITGSAPWGYNIDDVKSSQIEDAIKNLDFGKNKRHQIPVDIETPYGNRVINIDLKRIDKPSAKNLKRGADNWIDIESADFDGEDWLDALKNMGYDGYYKQEKGVKNLSVFNPNQIKSVHNSGAWSSSPSLTDAGWIPQTNEALANVVKNNDVVADAVKSVKRSYSSLKSLPDTDARVLIEARKLLSEQTTSPNTTLAYQAKAALGEFDPVINEVTGGKLAQANKIYENAYQFEKATDLGRDVFNSRISPDDLKFSYDAMTPLEQKAAKIGLRDELVNKIGSASNENIAAKKFIPRNVKEKLLTITGKNEGQKIIDEAEQAVRLNRNINKLLSGSQTAEKQNLRDYAKGLKQFVRHPWDTSVDKVFDVFDRGANERLARYLTDPNIADAFERVTADKAIRGGRVLNRDMFRQNLLRSIIENNGAE